MRMSKAQLAVYEKAKGQPIIALPDSKYCFSDGKNMKSDMAGAAMAAALNVMQKNSRYSGNGPRNPPADPEGTISDTAW